MAASPCPIDTTATVDLLGRDREAEALAKCRRDERPRGVRLPVGRLANLGERGAVGLAEERNDLLLLGAGARSAGRARRLGLRCVLRLRLDARGAQARRGCDQAVAPSLRIAGGDKAVRQLFGGPAADAA